MTIQAGMKRTTWSSHEKIREDDRAHVSRPEKSVLAEPEAQVPVGGQPRWIAPAAGIAAPALRRTW